MKALIVKTLIFLLTIVTGYYFLLLKPQKLEAETLRKDYFNLLQNRLAYVELTKMDPESVNFDIEKSRLVATLKETNKRGREETKDGRLKRLYEDQNRILEKTFQTKSYKDGVAILKSPEAIEVLTRETNLVLEYQYRLRQ